MGLSLCTQHPLLAQHHDNRHCRNLLHSIMEERHGRLVHEMCMHLRSEECPPCLREGGKLEGTYTLVMLASSLTMAGSSVPANVLPCYKVGPCNS